MIQLAALLAGFGGLLLEMIFVRRHGLLIGNTATAAAAVLGVFLLGLGVGGLWLPRTPLARRRPLATAAVLYALVALSAVLGDLLLQRVPPPGTVPGVVLVLLVPGVPAVLMGGAFPLLFAVAPRGAAVRTAAVLIGANLAGSVAATFVGGNFAVPELGLAASGWVGAGAYGVAALAVALRSRREPRVVVPQAGPGLAPTLPPVGRPEWLAGVAGFLVLALEILMLRRLPFFLDGFQPTLSGVLAACLLGLTVGAWFGPSLLSRVFGPRAATASVLLGAAVAAVGLHEWFAPAIGRIPVGSEIGVHLRVLAAALAAAGLPCFFLGATIPLCLAGFVHPETRAPLAGRLFFCQGVGSLLGAMAVGQVLPRCLPESFFLYTVSVVALIAVVAVWRELRWLAVVVSALILVLGVGGVTGGAAFRHAAAPVAGSRWDHPERYRYLAHRTDEVLTASVVYDRRSHGLILFTDEFRAAYIDPDSGYMKVLGHLPFLLREGLRRVAVVALGTGTTANAVTLWPDPQELHVVEISSAVVSMVDWFAKDGPGISSRPAPFRSDPRSRVHVTDGRRFIARRAPGSLDLVSMEPLLPYAPGTVPLYTREFYDHCRAALSEHGLMVQWVPTHSMPEHYFRTLLATFARSFEHHSVWLLNHSTLLVGSKTPHLPALAEIRKRMNGMPLPARRDLHGAGIATVEDLVAAMVGSEVLRVCDVPDLRDDRPFLERIGYWSGPTKLGFLPDNLAVLRGIASATGAWPRIGPDARLKEWSGMRIDRMQGLQDRALGRLAADQTQNALAVYALGRARDHAPRSVLLYGELQDARRELLEKVIQLAMPVAAPPAAVDVAAVRQYLDRRPDSAFLWAVLAVAEPQELAQHRAMRNALALDPTIYDQWPQLRLSWVSPDEIDGQAGPFEAMAELPPDAELLQRAAAPGPNGLAFRARFRVPVGYAALAVLAQRPLSGAEWEAFAAVLDPALLVFAARQIRGRGDPSTGDERVVRELLPRWPLDLPPPTELGELRAGDADQRRALATALRGRRGRLELTWLAELLLDTDLAVRRVAGVSLFQTLGDAIAYDPQATEVERQRAVEQLRRVIQKL